MSDEKEPGHARSAKWTIGLLMMSLFAIIAAAPAIAQTPPQTDVTAVDIWRQEDLCVANSIKQFPDQTLAGLRGRDHFVDTCLAAQHLPPRAHIAPDP